MRITGGLHRSRTLVAPRGSATRPTSDRVREALFGMLDAQGRIDGARVLDLYAGTGALGLEALSRGAPRAVFVESARPALAALRANVTALGLADRVRVVAAPVERALAELVSEAPFDLVLADPPYADVAASAPVAIARVVAAPLLHPDGRLVLEHASRDAAPAVSGLSLISSRAYGDTTLAFYALLSP